MNFELHIEIVLLVNRVPIEGTITIPMGDLIELFFCYSMAYPDKLAAPVL
jgi:hypothetical protein